MKRADIEKLAQAGLISDEQRLSIIAHFKLKEDDSRFLTIISFIGAILIASGIILLIAANWDEIPRGVKIGVGLMLMLVAHAGGWYLREVHKQFPKAGEALHLTGSLLFLGNIALVGQVYNLSSRAPNAILLWWGGIAALPWLLRSKAQHILALLAFGIWFGLEANARDSLLYFGSDEYQLLLYALLGLAYLGLGYSLRGTRFAEFAPATEKLGLLGFHVFVYPLSWGIFGRHDSGFSNAHAWVFPALSLLALVCVAAGSTRLAELTRQWRWTWMLALAGAIGLLAGAMYLAPEWNVIDYSRHSFGYHWIAAIGIFVFCLLEIQVGLQEHSPFMINLGIVLIALDILAIYIVLVGSMARTGVMFLVSGIFLIVFGIYLERKRRGLIRRLNTSELEEPQS